MNVPKKYKTAGGYNLGAWLQTQHRVCAGEQYGNLSGDRAVGNHGYGLPNKWWMDGFNHAKAYLAALNSDLWRQIYISPDGFKTGEIYGQICIFQRGGGCELKRAKLAEIGIDMNGEDRNPRAVRTGRARTGAAVNETI